MIVFSRLYKTDPHKYNECAREWTRKYAMWGKLQRKTSGTFEANQSVFALLCTPGLSWVGQLGLYKIGIPNNANKLKENLVYQTNKNSKEIGETVLLSYPSIALLSLLVHCGWTNHRRGSWWKTADSRTFHSFSPFAVHAPLISVMWNLWNKISYPLCTILPFRLGQILTKLG